MKLAGVMHIIEDREMYGDMLIVAYVVEVDDGELIADSEVEDTKFFDAHELPNRYHGFLRDLIDEI